MPIPYPVDKIRIPNLISHFKILKLNIKHLLIA